MVRELTKVDVVFEHLRKNLPRDGSVLSPEKSNAVSIRACHGKTGLFLYCNALIDAACTGWYLTDKPYGLQVVLNNRSQQAVLDTGLPLDRVKVSLIQVDRITSSGKSLIGDVVEFLEL